MGTEAGETRIHVGTEAGLCSIHVVQIGGDTQEHGIAGEGEGEGRGTQAHFAAGQHKLQWMGVCSMQSMAHAALSHLWTALLFVVDLQSMLNVLTYLMYNK